MTTCITVMGTGLALRGPDGSMVRAVEGAPYCRIDLSGNVGMRAFVALEACTTREPSSLGATFAWAPSGTFSSCCPGRSFGTGIVACCCSVAVIAWIKTLAQLCSGNP